MDIRPIAPEEHDALGELTVDTYLADGHLTFGAEDPYAEVLRDVAARDRAAEVLVAVEDGQVLGGVTFVPGPGPMSDLAGPTEAEIRMLVVGHEARGRRLGEQLVRACLDRARALGFTSMVLSSADTQQAAHHIYAKLGFRRVPDRDWHPVPDHPELTLMAFSATWSPTN